MSVYKIPLNKDVLQAAQERITWTLETLPRVCVSFFGGRDSGLVLHLTAATAHQLQKKINVLFIDWEAQLSCTIDYVQALRENYSDVIEEFYWVVLPLTTQNSLSQFQPEWQCWEPGTQWVRQPPADVITDPEFFSFYQSGMTFEQFIREFVEWLSQKRPAAMMAGIRADKSYNRFIAIANSKKQRFTDDKPWATSAPGGHTWYIYPIYDWETAGIWTWFVKPMLPYNPLYDLMYRAGVPTRYMRICEPFGPEKRQRLWLYHVIESECWTMMRSRVSGAKSGGTYAGQGNHFYGHRKILKPEHLSWQEYAIPLLKSMPETTAEYYRNKIAVYLQWYRKKGMKITP